MTFGESWGWGAPRDVAAQIYRRYREAGGNFIDTANIYTSGVSEALVGELIADERARVVVGTKFSLADGVTDPNAGGNHRKVMIESLEASLRRLKTDYVDIYWLHVWDRITPVEEVMRGLELLVQSGKVLHVGVSNAPAWWIARAHTTAEHRGWSPFCGLQVEYSLVERSVERELLPLAEHLDLAVLAWSPLGGGLLTGKYLDLDPQNARFHNTGIDGMRPKIERTRPTVEAVREVAQAIGVSPAQVALAWLRHQPVPIIPVLGIRRPHQLEDNLAALQVRLEPEHRARLRDAGAFELGYPHDFFNYGYVEGPIYGGCADLIDGVRR